MGDAVVSMSREQGFLEAYFLSLAQFGHDKAKLLAEKEKEAIKTQVGSIWNSMLTALAQLAVAEKSYMTLNFLASKGFLRKDNSVRQAYDSLIVELRKTEESGRMAPEDSLEKIIASLCEELGQFIYVRELLIDFYAKICNTGSNRLLHCGEIYEIICNICGTNQMSVHHPYLTLLKTTFSYECDTLALLLNAQQEMQQWLFFPSLMHLHAAHVKLTEWAALSQFKESRRLSFGPGFLKPVQLPHLYQWFLKFKGFLLSKFSLYFHEIISRQTNAQDIKNLCSKAPVDLYHKMSTFQRKSDALLVALLYEARGDDRYKGHGYHHPGKVSEKPKDPNDKANDYPVVLRCPGDAPNVNWSSVASTIDERVHELSSLERPVSFQDKLQGTYVVVRVEEKMYLVAFYGGKRSEKETYIATFLEEFCSQLRLQKMLQALRPGNK